LTGREDSRERNTRDNGATVERNAKTVLAADTDVMFIQSYYEGNDYEELVAQHTNDLISSVENGGKDWAKVSETVKQFLKG